MQTIKKNEHVIKAVSEGSIASELGIQPGDVLLAVNDEPVTDVFDYRFKIKDVDLISKRMRMKIWVWNLKMT